MSATFSSTLISDSTRANEIDNKVMDLLTAIVRVLADDGGTWGTDHAVLQPIFDWYESGTSEGYFGTIRMRGSATENDIRIRDMVNSKEFRITVADGASTPALKIQYNAGSEGTPSWTNILTVTGTDLIFSPGFDGIYNTNGNIQGYIDAIREELIDLIGSQSAGVSGVRAATYSGILVEGDQGTYHEGDVTIDLLQSGRSPGYSLQCGVGNAVGWAEQAVPATAKGTASYNGTPAAGALLSFTNDGSCDRGGMTFAGNDLDLPSQGLYLFTVVFSGSVNNAAVVDLQILLDGGGASFVSYQNVGASAAFTIMCSTMIYRGASPATMQVQLGASVGVTVIGTGEATCVRCW